MKQATEPRKFTSKVLTEVTEQGNSRHLNFYININIYKSFGNQSLPC